MRWARAHTHSAQCGAAQGPDTATPPPHIQSIYGLAHSRAETLCIASSRRPTDACALAPPAGARSASWQTRLDYSVAHAGFLGRAATPVLALSAKLSPHAARAPFACPPPPPSISAAPAAGPRAPNPVSVRLAGPSGRHWFVGCSRAARALRAWLYTRRTQALRRALGLGSPGAAHAAPRAAEHLRLKRKLLPSAARGVRLGPGTETLCAGPGRTPRNLGVTRQAARIQRAPGLRGDSKYSSQVS